ncbi:outer membrane beta-barrel protein [Terrihabitans sp. PJ23]|uniref:Outer membrane beta-barrel protein n=1 Tax=Terrihabitans rhizophilus TaxID=3092662 RepID=A0ABU4RSR0_9HYPH|nr:outer membrane beta-barrel protein [Terrihabitans sp. PJ23]
MLPVLLISTDVGAQELRGALPLPGEQPTASRSLSETDLSSSQPLAESTAFDPGPSDAAPLPGLTSELLAAPGESAASRRRAISEDDPYAPVGLKAGSFIFLPRLDQNVGVDSNPRRERGGEGSAYSRTLGRLDVESEWLRHSLRGSIQAGYTAYREFPDLDAPDFLGEIEARADVRRDMRLDLSFRLTKESESPGDPDLPEGVSGRPDILRYGGTAGFTIKPNRASLALQALAERSEYGEAVLNNGEVVDNTDRNVSVFELKLRTGYELSPALEPFLDVAVNRREHDQTFDDLGFRRSSDGYEIAIGARFEPSVVFAMTGKVGYRQQTPDDPTLDSINGLVTEGSLVWRPTALTTVTLAVDSGISETTRADSSGALARSASARVDHALRRNLLLSGSLVFQRSDYAGSDYRIDETTAELGVEYRFTRTVAVRGRLAHQDYRTSLPGEDYTANVVEAGISLRR